jgi:hypothetical protein
LERGWREIEGTSRVYCILADTTAVHVGRPAGSWVVGKHICQINNWWIEDSLMQG